MKKVKYYATETDKIYFWAKSYTKSFIVNELKWEGHKNIKIEEKPDWLGKIQEEKGKVENWLKIKETTC